MQQLVTSATPPSEVTTQEQQQTAAQLLAYERDMLVANAPTQTRRTTVTSEEIMNRRIEYSEAGYQIRTLLSDESLWYIPEYQREFVMSPSDQRYLILTMLYGYPIAPLIVIERTSPEGVIYFEVNDGSQRLRAIRSFVKNEFKTPSARAIAEAAPQSSLSPFGEMYYRQLPSDIRNRFLSYQVHQVILRKISDEEARTLYLHSQIKTQQTAGEVMRSYSTIVVSFARTFCPWEQGWHRLYALTTKYKKDLRQERLLAVMAMLAMESAKEHNYHIILKKANLLHYASVRYTNHFTPAVYSAFTRRFELLKHAFAGVAITSRGFLTVMYQAVCRLDDAGYDLLALPEGCLTPWFTNLRTQRDAHGLSPVSYMTEPRNQHAFWKEQWPYLLHRYEGLPRLARPGIPTSLSYLESLSQGTIFPTSQTLPLLTRTGRYAAETGNNAEEEEDDEEEDGEE